MAQSHNDTTAVESCPVVAFTPQPSILLLHILDSTEFDLGVLLSESEVSILDAGIGTTVHSRCQFCNMDRTYVE